MPRNFRMFVIGSVFALLVTLSSERSSFAQGGMPHTTPEEHGLSAKAVEIGSVFGFPITNSMAVSWVVALGLIIFARTATRRMDQVPGGAQNFLEWLVESLYGFLEGLLGKHLVNRTFWFFATVFIFILTANLLGLIPGVGTIGWGHVTSHGFKVDQPLLRGANADVNLTLAMALVFFVCWIVWALREVGPLGFLKELFAPKGESSGFLKIVLAVDRKSTRLNSSHLVISYAVFCLKKKLIRGVMEVRTNCTHNKGNKTLGYASTIQCRQSN